MDRSLYFFFVFHFNEHNERTNGQLTNTIIIYSLQSLIFIWIMPILWPLCDNRVHYLYLTIANKWSHHDPSLILSQSSSRRHQKEKRKSLMSKCIDWKTNFEIGDNVLIIQNCESPTIGSHKGNQINKDKVKLTKKTKIYKI